MRNSEIISFGIILLFFITGALVYPYLDEVIASHWNVQGKADIYMSKTKSLFLMPLISLVLFLFFIMIPRIDPVKQNINIFRKHYDVLMVLIFGFLFYIYILTVLLNIGFKFSIIRFLAPAFSIFFYCCGILTENLKRNNIIGIRTPWTLNNEKVWNKTHRIGGKLFKIAGIISFFGMLFQDYALFFVIIPVILVAVCTSIYSYIEYQNEIKKQ